MVQLVVYVDSQVFVVVDFFQCLTVKGDCCFVYIVGVDVHVFRFFDVELHFIVLYSSLYAIDSLLGAVVYFVEDCFMG